MTNLSSEAFSELSIAQVRVFLCLFLDRAAVLIDEFGSSQARADMDQLSKVIWQDLSREEVFETKSFVVSFQQHEDFTADDSWREVYYSMRAHGIVVAILRGIGGKGKRINKLCCEVSNEFIAIVGCLDAPAKGTYTIVDPFDEGAWDCGEMEGKELENIESLILEIKTIADSTSSRLKSLRKNNGLHARKIARAIKKRFSS